MVFTAAGEGAPALKSFFLDRYRESYRRGWVAFVDAVARGAGRGRRGGRPQGPGDRDRGEAFVPEGRTVRMEEVEPA